MPPIVNMVWSMYVVKQFPCLSHRFHSQNNVNYDINMETRHTIEYMQYSEQLSDAFDPAIITLETHCEWQH